MIYKITLILFTFLLISMYTAKITREHHSAFVLLLDCSGSMNEEFVLYGEQTRKKDGVTLIVNMLIEELINRSRREEGIIDYFDLCVIGYGDDRVSFLLGDERSPFVSISNLMLQRTTYRKFGITRELPDGKFVRFEYSQRCWIESQANGSTPMKKAIDTACDVLKVWCRQTKNQKSFPPTVINVTDGEASDADNDELRDCAQDLKSLSTDDGQVLFVNIHLAGSQEDGEFMVSFPSETEELPVIKYAELLHDMSSTIPSSFNPMLMECKDMAHPPFRAVCYNCPPDKLFGMFAIGSASASLMM